jgi:hypothetical protein
MLLRQERRNAGLLNASHMANRVQMMKEGNPHRLGARGCRDACERRHMEYAHAFFAQVVKPHFSQCLVHRDNAGSAEHQISGLWTSLFSSLCFHNLLVRFAFTTGLSILLSRSSFSFSHLRSLPPPTPHSLPPSTGLATPPDTAPGIETSSAPGPRLF